MKYTGHRDNHPPFDLCQIHALQVDCSPLPGYGMIGHITVNLKAANSGPQSSRYKLDLLVLLHLARRQCSGYYRSKAANAECPVDGQAEQFVRGALAHCLSQVMYRVFKFIDPFTGL